MVNIVVQLQLRLVCSAVSPGAPSCSLRGLSWSVLLIAAQSHLERHPDLYACHTRSVTLTGTWSHQEHHPDIVTRSHWSVILTITRSHLKCHPDRYAVSLGAPS